MNKIIKEDLKIICSSDLDWERFKDSTVLISGAYGMLSSYMVFTLMYLNEICPHLNIHIIALGRNYVKLKKRFHEYLKNSLFSIICGDVANKVTSNGNVDFIIHGARPASSQFYGVDPISIISANVLGTNNLLELAKEKKSKGFLFFSSGEVCGKINKESIAEEDGGFLDPTDIRNCYGESKRMAENMCKCWSHQHHVPTFVVRPEHTYGPTMDLENDRRVFAEFVSDIVNHRNITIKSDGLAVRTFCYIGDATDGFFRALLKGATGESYNVGNYAGRMSISDLAHLLVSLFPDKHLKIVYQDRGDTEAYLENKHKVRPMLSTAKLEALGYKCKTSVRDGFNRTIKSYLCG